MPFHIKEHIIPCQHIHQYHDAKTLDKRLSVKQYKPLSNPFPSLGDVTIIATHGNGLVKELYEPLWEDLERLLRERGRRIRSIWIADMSNQGASGLLNQDAKYDDVSWYDHSRDLLHMANVFRSEIIQPIVGVGHSMGANLLTMLSLGHPMLFSSLVLMEPVMSMGTIMGMGSVLALQTLRRRTEWPSRKAAEETSQKAFRSWDPRVLERWNRYALYPYPRSGSGEAEKPQSTRLLTGRFQELTGIVRPEFIYSGSVEFTEKMNWVGEVTVLNKIIEFIPCSTFYICAAKGVSASAKMRKDWLLRTGMGSHGSPHMGRKLRKRKVEDIVLPDLGHFAPLEAPVVCAEAAAKWIDEDIKSWEDEEESLKRTWGNFSAEEKEEKANAWMSELKAKM